MNAPVKSIPQPLGGLEIKKGIAVRMTQDLPADVAEALREQIVAGLGKTCSLHQNFAYAKFKATWRLNYSMKPELKAMWWVDYELNDFGRITKGGIGGRVGGLFEGSQGDTLVGTIDETPPDKFRRETDQPIPRPTELKPPEPEKSTFSKSTRGGGRRRQV